MKKGLVVFFLVCLIAILSCTDSDHIPLPGEINFNPLLGNAYQFFQGYGNIKDMHSNTQPVVFFIDKDKYPITPGSNVEIQLNIDHPGGKIYNKAFVSTIDASNPWKEVSLPGTQDSEGFIDNSAQATAILTPAEYDLSTDGKEIHYALGYSCFKHNNVYRCGCRDASDFACNKFRIHTFEICDNTFHDVSSCSCSPTCEACTGTITQENDCGESKQIACNLPAAVTCTAPEECVNDICQTTCTLGEQKCADDKMSLLECDGTSFIYKKDCIFNFGFVAPGCSEVDENNNPISPPDCINT